MAVRAADGGERPVGEGLRFFAVACAGLALDLAVAWVAARFLGLPLWLAAGLGFCVAAAVNYALLELWAFRGGARRLSALRALRYGGALAVALAVRVATVAALDALLGGGHDLPVLLTAAGVSFVVHFLLSKRLVFRRPATPEGAP